MEVSGLLNKSSLSGVHSSNSSFMESSLRCRPIWLHSPMAEDRQHGIPQGELEHAKRQGSADNTRWLVRENGQQYWRIMPS